MIVYAALSLYVWVAREPTYRIHSWLLYAALSLYVRDVQVAGEPTHRINSWLPMRMYQESDILAFADCLAFSIGIPVMFIACYLGREVHMRYWN